MRKMNLAKGFQSKDARVEAINILLQGPGEPMSIHLDRFNDNSVQGQQHKYQYTVSAWKSLKIDGIPGVTGVALLGYAQKSISNAI